MNTCFTLEVLPDEQTFEVPGEIEEAIFDTWDEDDLFRPGEDNEIIRPRRY